MTKFVKMSLAAAVAVAGLNTAASAGSLEEAIKGVDISGKVEVGYNNYNTGNDALTGLNYVAEDTAGADESNNEAEYDIDIAFKIPVNDQVTATVGFQADHANNTETDATDETAINDITMTQMYFTYANGPLTVMAGKQGMAGAPWFDDEKADGVVALYNAGVATVAAAHFRNSNTNVNVPGVGTVADALQEQDINAAAVIGSVAGVNASLWYADISDTGKSYSINVNGKYDIVSVDVRHTNIDTDEDGLLGGIEGSLTKVVVTAGLEAATLAAGYATTSDEDGNYMSVDLTGDNDAATNFALDDLSVAQFEDAQAFLVGAVVPMDKFTLSAMYVDGEVDSLEVDFDELDVEVSYALSKNFTASVLYTDASISEEVYDSQSIQTSLKYSF
jgi:hypothetical protein